MDLNQMIGLLKEHPDYPRMGMIASHLGVVRNTSLNGKPVQSIHVSFDKEKINKIVKEIKMMDGIIEVLVDISEGRLTVGQEIMAVAVGGDTREHVFPALIQAVDRIKSEAARKQEEYKAPAEKTGQEG